jgi:hypothetical protein
MMVFVGLILSVIPRSSAATGTNHMRTATSVEHDSHEMPRSSAAIGSFTLAQVLLLLLVQAVYLFQLENYRLRSGFYDK